MMTPQFAPKNYGAPAALFGGSSVSDAVEYTVYILKSLKNGRHYIGYTSKTIAERILWHQQGATPWARNNKPFELVHSEKFSDKSAALKRERYLKTGQGRKTVTNILASKVKA